MASAIGVFQSFFFISTLACEADTPRILWLKNIVMTKAAK
jgi:hypothetical protein